jgi:hypothetical protein
VTGVPGSGKTLAGLQLVHAKALAALLPTERRDASPAVFLSGNDPLVEVIQYALRSKHFVQALRHYLREHADVARPGAA